MPPGDSAPQLLAGPRPAPRNYAAAHCSFTTTANAVSGARGSAQPERPACLLHAGKHYFLSRPRRFGKSLFLDAIKELFKGLHIHHGWNWSERTRWYGWTSALGGRIGVPDCAGTLRVPAESPAPADGEAGRGAGRRVRQTDPGCAGDSRGGARQPQRHRVRGGRRLSHPRAA